MHTKNNKEVVKPVVSVEDEEPTYCICLQVCGSIPLSLT